MKITKEEIKKINKNIIFKKKINNKDYWVKPILNSSYLQGNIQSHKRYLKTLERYLKGFVPKYKLSILNIENKKILLIIAEDIKGRKINEKQLKKLINLKINSNLKTGMLKLLKRKISLDFYGNNNFIKDKNDKLYYIDSRMPIFTKKSNEGNRYTISKNKTIKLLKD